ncbi:MAG TPA: ABC transporter ATP-binding protein, partial [bacterium]|nr:ABC transporter ATP-binding protein [bacterium]
MSSQNSPESALEIRGLEKTFYTFHLGPLDLTVPVGAVYGLIGPNGAGKTTTIDLVVGLGRNDSGTIKVLGFDHIRDEVELKKRVGYVSPDLDFLAWRTVGALISFICAFYPEWDFDYCENLLARFHLLRDAKISELSLGERTKLALTLVLPRRPPLLLLDEPTIGLDAISKKEFFAEILKLVEDGHHSVLISSHGLSDIERFADHIG